MTNDERDVLHHIERAQTADEGAADIGGLSTVVLHVGVAIALAVLEVARAIREKA